MSFSLQVGARSVWYRWPLARSVQPLLICGAAAIAYNAWKWRQDRVLADGLRTQLAQPRPAMKAHPRVSILVAACNESQLVQRHIKSVLGLSYPNIEYVLCAGGTDETYAIADQYT